jgi:hypothetical protein
VVYTAWINFLIWSRRSDVWSKQISISSKVGLCYWIEWLLCWSWIWYMSAWVMGHMTFYPGNIKGIEQLVDKSSWNQSECLLNVGWCCCVSVAKDDCMHIVRFLCAKCERNLETVLCSVLTKTWGLIFTSYQFPWVIRVQWFSWGEKAKLVQCTFELKSVAIACYKVVWNFYQFIKFVSVYSDLLFATILVQGKVCGITQMPRLLRWYLSHLIRFIKIWKFNTR